MAIAELTQEHLKKWPHLKEFIELRPECRCFIHHADGVMNTILLTNANRIVSIYTAPEARRTGFATGLIRYAMNHDILKPEHCAALVEKQNTEALCMLLKMGFHIVGKDVTWKEPRYLMRYQPVVPAVPDGETNLRKDLEDVLDKTHFVESEVLYV